MRLFEHAEARLKEQGFIPLSIDPNRASLEQVMLKYWAASQNPSLAKALKAMRARTAVMRVTPVADE